MWPTVYQRAPSYVIRFISRREGQVVAGFSIEAGVSYAGELPANILTPEPSPHAPPVSYPKAGLFGWPIFLSAGLLFSLEPLIAKIILPWFGGSAAVWSTCLVFYQVALLAGYLYAELVTRFLRANAQAVVHIVLLAASLALLPIGPAEGWKPVALNNPASLIFEMLGATIGLPCRSGGINGLSVSKSPAGVSVRRS